MQSVRSKSRRGRVCIALFAAAAISTSLVPQAAHAAANYSLAETHEVGGVNRNAEVDDARERVYVAADRADGAPGSAIGWLDLATGAPAAEQIELSSTDPAEIELSVDGERLYVAHDRTGVLSVVSLDTNAVTEISGMPKYPSGIVEDTDTGLIYVFDSGGLTRVDPTAGTASAPIAVSGEKYPLVKDAVYDSQNHMIWIAEGRAKVLTGYSTAASSWLDSIAIPVATAEFDGEALGGRPSLLALDETLGELHVGVLPTISDDWENTRVVSLRVADRAYVGAPIEVGENSYEMLVNPATHEVVTTDGFSNMVSVISPDTWTATTAVDFTAAGVTSGTGSGEANLWGLGASADGTHLYVSHPYTSQLSDITRSGDRPTPTVRDIAPGQGQPTTPPAENAPWEGPDAPAPAAAPAGARQIANGELNWAINDYMLAWAPHLLGEATRTDDVFGFTAPAGWWDPATGEAELVWTGGVRIQHYPGLVPELTTTIGNPRLVTRADGSGELSFDVAWNVSANLASDGFKRVSLATFENSAVQLADDSVTMNASPDFAGRALEIDGYTYPDSYPADYVTWLDPQLRSWWLSTGASMDAEKAPAPVSLALTLGAPVVDAGSSGSADSSSGVGSAGSADSSGSTGSAGNSDAAGGATNSAGTGSEAAAYSGSSSNPSAQVTQLSNTGFLATPVLLAGGALLLLGVGVLLLVAVRAKRRAASAAAFDPELTEE
ncbi:HtaA domain-containing protein [Leucobacter salsicius]|uniref:HtaA domain-containing protein n=1 Tax=Leucobacter salsicius TaxID=664638 RepID=UPI0018DC927B|nr:HtaA domain-containing protein [Leucobacter salsicius]